MAWGRILLKCSKLFKRVVARDGIEPPTPAFSGPRSTTELSGLSALQGNDARESTDRREDCASATTLVSIARAAFAAKLRAPGDPPDCPSQVHSSRSSASG